MLCSLMRHTTCRGVECGVVYENGMCSVPEHRDPPVLQVDAISVEDELGKGKTMCRGDLMEGECRAGEHEISLDLNLEGGVVCPVNGGRVFVMLVHTPRCP